MWERRIAFTDGSCKPEGTRLLVRHGVKGDLKETEMWGRLLALSAWLYTRKSLAGSCADREAEQPLARNLKGSDDGA
jgi:hypothetical protein